MKEGESQAYPVDAVNRVKRLAERGHYDHATVHALLDAAMLCHVAYIVDGQPFCTPSLFWREGQRVYWHGSNSSRMLRRLSSGEPVCLTVTHFDSIVLARCGFNHSADYRSAMLFGHAKLIDDLAEKTRALRMMVDRFFPGRTAQLRQSTPQEINATTVLVMDIERASAKIRTKGVSDDDEDYELPVYAEKLPVYQVLGKAEACPRLLAGVSRPANLMGYRDGRPLEEALTEAHRAAYPVEER
jgi:nitroimidazol reductase NimA-like FMN-containing flavoprotein (pyridoxamine 5'-phosphate oxidase superfamily)